MSPLMNILKYLLVISVFLVTISAMLPESDINSNNISKGNRSLQNEVLRGIGYGPHRDNENPNFGVQPSEEELRQDLTFIADLNTPIRTYGATDNLELIPLIAEEYGIDNYPGAWISRFPCENERQVQNIIDIANKGLSNVKGLIVGNEVLLRNDISEDQLLDFISRVKQATNLPVATAEVWEDWHEHPRLGEAVDIILVHVYPYWDGKSIDEGVDYVYQRWKDVKDLFPNKPVVIGETGWPSEGEPRGSAVPSPENQLRFFKEFVDMAEAEDIDYFYFEIFDEKWKIGEGVIGTSWGLYNSDGSIKEHMKAAIPPELHGGIDRQLRDIGPTYTNFPLYLYSDGCAPENAFFSSGWMGELAEFSGDDNDTTFFDFTQIIDEMSTEKVYTGETSIRISYTPSSGQWGGIYWQYPVNNWGQYPGYDLGSTLSKEDTVLFSFWAAGELGGEKAEFITGGINDDTLTYRDSFGPESTGVIPLTQDGEVYEIMLTGKDLSQVLGGFAWVTNDIQNPAGSTIYLDDIKFELLNNVRPHLKSEIPDTLLIAGGADLKLNLRNYFDDRNGDILSYEFMNSDSIVARISFDGEDLKITPLNKGTAVITISASDGEGMIQDDFEVDVPTGVSIDEVDAGLKEFSVDQNYPNPFLHSTTIPFYIPQRSDVSITIYDLLGRKIANAELKELPSGQHRYEWNARGIAAGTYFYHIKAGSFEQVKSFLLVK